MSHKTLVNGTAYEITSGKTLVNGTAYDIACGKTLVGGTAYDIPFGTRLGDLPVGNSVFLTVNGSLKEFLIVHQGLPSSSYDSSCNGTWVLMKEPYETRQWHSSNSNSYKASTIHTYLNGTFLGLFDANIKTQIKTVKIPYVNGTSSSAVASGSNGLSTQIFLLSGNEVGGKQSDYSMLTTDGYCLSYFSGTSKTDSKRIAYINGTTKKSWWLRSPDKNSSSYPWAVKQDGSLTDEYLCNAAGSACVRPALILSNDLLVDGNLCVIA